MCPLSTPEIRRGWVSYRAAPKDRRPASQCLFKRWGDPGLGFQASDRAARPPCCNPEGLDLCSADLSCCIELVVQTLRDRKENDPQGLKPRLYAPVAA
jgi:hypothetical protein